MHRTVNCPQKGRGTGTDQRGSNREKYPGAGGLIPVQRGVDMLFISNISIIFYDLISLELHLLDFI